MQEFHIDTEEAYSELQYMLDNGEAFIVSQKDNRFVIKSGKESFAAELSDEFKNKLTDINPIIYGKNTTQNIVNISVKDDIVYIFTENKGKVEYRTKQFKQWVLSPKVYTDFKKLEGNQHFRYYAEYSEDEFSDVAKKIYHKGLYTIWNKAENFMTRHGYTYFKGMRVSDVSVLSFDIETSGLNPRAHDAKVFLITNCYRKNGQLTQRTFNVEDYNDQYDMIRDWCSWVREMDPSAILGHNIVIFDIPYLETIMQDVGESLKLGRLDTEIEIEEKERELRKDGSQSYSYKKINVFGRELIDTFFVAIKADIARKYESYGLKAIVKHEGLDKENRVYYDASKIKTDWNDLEKRKLIIAYAEADAEDPIKLYDLMISNFFYLTPHIPKTFQSMIESATGSQINVLMVRSYLQFNFSVAKGDDKETFEGGLSYGNPGVYKNCIRWDISNMYPSIMVTYRVFPKGKDFNGNFLKALTYFREERLKNKKLAKETNDRYYKDLEQAQKVFANSTYGFLGASGLNYNYPNGAAEITRHGREILTAGIKWATGKDVNDIFGKETESA